MSNIDHIIEERSTQIGQFLVGRLLPFRSKRMVGPFIFIDHMGPASLEHDEPLAIGAHPHIGLSTLTYLLEGSILHKDSLGTEQIITPGAVNWMTAGSGIAHSEHSTENATGMLHGIQIWVALPKELEEMEPTFHHTPANLLPKWNIGSAELTLIAGTFGEHTSPVPVHSKLYCVEIKASSTAQEINITDYLFGECAIYILAGDISLDGTKFSDKQLLVSEHPNICSIQLHAGAHIFLFGGIPFEEERFIYWNFVATSQERIERAKEDWKNKRFKAVPNETEWIPLPENKQR